MRASLSFTPKPNSRGASGGMEGGAAEAERVAAVVAAMLLDTGDAEAWCCMQDGGMTEGMCPF